MKAVLYGVEARDWVRRKDGSLERFKTVFCLMANTWVGLMVGRWVSSCQDASGHVMSWMDYGNLDFETIG